MVQDEIDEIVVVIYELNLATSTKSAEWRLDSGATIHVCHDKNQFKNYEANEKKKS